LKNPKGAGEKRKSVARVEDHMKKLTKGSVLTLKGDPKRRSGWRTRKKYALVENAGGGGHRNFSLQIERLKGDLGRERERVSNG